MSDELQEPEGQEEAPQAEERPSWLPDNFKSPEDFRASYEAQQRKITELGQTKSELETALEAASQQQVAQPEYDQDRLLTAFEENPLETVAWIAQQSAQAAVQAAQAQRQDPTPDLVALAVDQTLSAKHADWGEYREKVGMYLQENPHVQNVIDSTSVAGVSKGLETVYQILKAQTVLSSQQQHEATQQVAQADAINAAQTLTGQGAKPPVQTPAEAEFEAMKAAARSLGYASGL